MSRIGIVLGIIAVLAVTAGSALAAEGEQRARPLMGEVTKIDGKTLTIKGMREGATEQTVTLDDATQITKEAAVKLEDVKVGDRIRIVQGEKTVYGEVAKIEGKTITVKSRRGDTEQAVTVDEKTQIMGSVKATIEDIKVGVVAAVTSADGKVTRVNLMAPRTPREGRDKAKKKAE
jgi:hypothetical protein